MLKCERNICHIKENIYLEVHTIWYHFINEKGDEQKMRGKFKKYYYLWHVL